MSQTIAAALIVFELAPAPDQGETQDSPKPMPRMIRTNANAAVTKAPPMTAAHETPDALDSA